MRGAALLLLALLAGCETTGDARDTVGLGDAGAGSAEAAAPAGDTAAALPDPDALPAPEGRAPRRAETGLVIPDQVEAPDIYLALQPDESAGTVSVVFAIDTAGDGTPGDDPAVRITPDAGACNPQELSRYAFTASEAERPVFSRTEALTGITTERLPAYMAVTVTRVMLARGLADDREATRPQNICTRKLWERLVANDRVARAAAAPAE